MSADNGIRAVHVIAFGVAVALAAAAQTAAWMAALC